MLASLVINNEFCLTLRIHFSLQNALDGFDIELKDSFKHLDCKFNRDIPVSEDRNVQRNHVYELKGHYQNIT